MRECVDTVWGNVVSGMWHLFLFLASTIYGQKFKNINYVCIIDLLVIVIIAMLIILLLLLFDNLIHEY